jgi:integrase
VKRTRVERGLYRQANGNYGIYVLANGQLRWKTVGAKLSEARRERDLLRARAHQGELPLRCTLTLAQVAATWIESFEALVRSGERAERTLEHYRYQLRHNILPTLGHKKVQAISTDDCAQLITTLRARGLSPKTISGALVPLGRMFSLALRRGYINSNPLDRLDSSERPRVHKREQRVLTHVEMRKLLGACLPTHRPLIATALYTGMRLSELLGLVWAEVDFEGGLIHLRSQLARSRRSRPAERVRLKTKAAARDIPLFPQLGALLRAHKLASSFSGPSDFVFPTALGTPHSYRNVERRGLRRAADLAGLNNGSWPPLRLHDLRHTFASHLIIDLHLDVAQVSRILGHARASITLDTYTHLFDQAAHAADIRERMAASEFARQLSSQA